MREVMEGLYELFLLRDPKLELYQGIFNTFPDINEWSMNDLYSRHPDPAKSFLYMYCCRKDDVIVLNNGEKVAPALMEATLMSDPLIKGAMVVGRGKFQPAALIDLVMDPPKSVKERHQIVERLLPVISEVNAESHYLDITFRASILIIRITSGQRTRTCSWKTRSVSYSIRRS